MTLTGGTASHELNCAWHNGSAGKALQGGTGDFASTSEPRRLPCRGWRCSSPSSQRHQRGAPRQVETATSESSPSTAQSIRYRRRRRVGSLKVVGGAASTLAQPLIRGKTRLALRHRASARLRLQRRRWRQPFAPAAANASTAQAPTAPWSCHLQQI